MIARRQPPVTALPALVLSLVAVLAANARADSPYDFELYDLSDRLLNLAKVRQSARLLLVDFFSESCQPCKAALPSLRRLHERFAAKGLAVVIVAVPGSSDDREEARRITERIFAEQPMPFRVTWDKYRRVAAQYGVAKGNAIQVPRAFLLSPKGALLRKVVAAVSLTPELARRLR